LDHASVDFISGKNRVVAYFIALQEKEINLALLWISLGRNRVFLNLAGRKTNSPATPRCRDYLIDKETLKVISKDFADFY
jgi:hypothetical protein